MDYWVQTNADMNPVRVENLSETEAQGIVKLLKALANEGELVFIRDCKYEEDLYENYDQWQAVNSSTQPVTASDSGELIGYGVNYRNFHTAVHGIFWTPDEMLARTVAIICYRLDDPVDDQQYEDSWNELESYLASNELFHIEEINYRDITKDNKYYCNDDQYIEIVNAVAVDLFL